MNKFLIIVLGTYAVWEFFACLLCIVITMSNNNEDELSLKTYLHNIFKDLLYSEEYNFPLRYEVVDDYTTFGKWLFVILWIMFSAIPFICGVILSFIILSLIKFIKRLCYK